MGAMPRHDPVPPRHASISEPPQDAWRQYKRMMGWMALVAAATVALSLIYLRMSGGPMPIHMVIATILGVGLTVLVGTGLMGLVFLSSRTGHDEDAAHGGQDDDRRN